MGKASKLQCSLPQLLRTITGLPRRQLAYYSVRQIFTTPLSSFIQSIYFLFSMPEYAWACSSHAGTR